MGGAAIILTKDEEERIRADPDCQEGLARISEDRNIAQNISEWSELLSRRFNDKENHSRLRPRKPPQ